MQTADKILILMRHATPENPPGTADHDRPLSAAGLDEAARMAACLAAKNIRPDVILTSSAQRTQETAQAFHSLCPNILVLRDLYHATPQALAAAIAEVDDIAANAKIVMVVAHNPGIEAFHEKLSGHDIVFDPATLALIACKGDGWESALRDTRRLGAPLRPESCAAAKGNSAGRYQP